MQRAFLRGWAAVLVIVGVLGVLFPLGWASAQQASPPPKKKPRPALIACERPRQVSPPAMSWYLDAPSGTIYPIPADKNSDGFGFNTESLVFVTLAPNHPSCLKAPKAASVAPAAKLASAKNDAADKTQAERKEAERKETERKAAETKRKEAERKKAEQETIKRELARREHKAEAMQQSLPPRAQPKRPAATNNAPAARSIDPSRLPPPGSVELPLLALTDVGAFAHLHKFIDQRIDALEPKIDAAQRAPFTIFDATPMRPLIAEFKDVLMNGCVPQTRARWVQAKATTAAAAQETDPTKKREGFRKAGAETEALLVLTQLMQLDVDVLTVADVGEQKGVPFLKSYPELYNYGSDPRITPLRKAALQADVAKMIEALPAATARFQEIVKALDQRVAEIKVGAEISKKVVQAADILMIGISIYQVAKIPTIPKSDPLGPLTVVGALPGGAALGSSVSVASVASVVESIQKLVAIGALDGAIIAHVGKMGGDSTIALPELQRPTGLSLKESTPVRRGADSGSPRPRVEKVKGPDFPKLKDHASRHSNGLSTNEYYNQAVANIKTGTRLRVYHDGEFKFAYITRLNKDWVRYTATDLSGKTIFTHMDVLVDYLPNKGITLPKGF